MAVVCSSLIPCHPGQLLRYCVSDFEMVPVAPVLPVSLLFVHSTCAVLWLYDHYIIIIIIIIIIIVITGRA